MVFTPRNLLWLMVFSASWAHAAVVRVEVSKREDLGKSGYEQITGKLRFELDPTLPGNAIIADERSGAGEFLV